MMLCERCIHESVCEKKTCSECQSSYCDECGIYAMYDGAVNEDCIKHCKEFIDKEKFAEIKFSQWVHEGKPIHCKACGYTPEHSLNKNNSNFCPNCGLKIIK